MENLIGTIVPYQGDFIFLDVETCNSKCNICAMAAIVVENGHITKVINELINPDANFDNGFYHEHMHHISSEDVKNKDNLLDIWKNKFSFYTDDFVIVAYNAASADCAWIQNDLKRYNYSLTPIKYIDPYRLAQKFITKAEITSKLGISRRFYTRDTICRYIGCSPIENHNALSDVIDCFNIFNWLYNNFKFDIKSCVGYKHETNGFDNKEMDKTIKKEIDNLSKLNKIIGKFKCELLCYMDDLEAGIENDTEQLLNLFNEMAPFLNEDFSALYYAINKMLDNGVVEFSEEENVLQLLDEAYKKNYSRIRSLQR